MEYTEIKEFLAKRLNGVAQGARPNQYSTSPVFLAAAGTRETLTANVDFYNEIRAALKSSDMAILERSPSGAIRKGPRYTSNLYAWDERKSSIGVCLTACCGGFTYVVKFGNFKGKKAPELYPNIAFNMFKDKCKDYGVNLDSYVISNGEEVKKTVPKPIIDMHFTHKENSKPLTNVHHIDFHNSFPAGLANTHPEFRKPIEELYLGRKEHPEYKFVLNDSIGWMHSWRPDKGRFACWAHLAADAIKDNNNRIHDLCEKLILTGRVIIGRNTDGIWYQGPIYHGDGEGPGLGQWENDHINCSFRAKSDGVYEFIENGEYHAVVRGLTGKDSIEPDRTRWSWGDIFTTKEQYFTLDDEKGIIYHGI